MTIESIHEITIQEYLTNRLNVLDTAERALFDFDYLTGARITEELTVKTQDINIPNRTVNLLTEKNTKDAYRTVMLYPHDQVFLDSVQTQLEGKQIGEQVFKFTRHKAWRLSKRYFGCAIHSFRHTHAIQLVRDVGLSQVELMNQMGWSDLKSCMSYLKYETTKNIRDKMGLEP